MSSYVPAFDFMSTRYALQANTLHVNRGQWVTNGSAKGRLVSLGKKLQVIYRMAGESFRGYVLRFKVAVYKSVSIRRPSSGYTQLSLDLVQPDSQITNLAGKETNPKPTWHRDRLLVILSETNNRFHHEITDCWVNGFEDAIHSRPQRLPKYGHQYYRAGYRIGLRSLSSTCEVPQ